MPYIPEMTLTDTMCQEKEEEEDLPSNQHKTSAEDYINKRGERLISATRNNTDNTSINKAKITENKNAKKNNSIDISSDQQATTHLRKLGHG